MMKELSQSLRGLEEEKVNALVEHYIKEDLPVLEIIDALNEGMVGVGELFSKKTYFISQLLYSAEILKGVMKKLEPLLEGNQAQNTKKKVVIGTVKGDVHDIGKNIAVTLMRGSGYEVIDLGVNVPAEKFVQAVKETGTKVLGLSALLTSTYPEMKNVVDAIVEAGLGDQVKIIIGGAPVNEQVRVFSGADFAAIDAVDGVNICKKIYG